MARAQYVSDSLSRDDPSASSFTSYEMTVPLTTGPRTPRVNRFRRARGITGEIQRRRGKGSGGIFKTSAIEILRDRKCLMSTGDITREALKRGMLKACKGKTPEATMASALYSDVKTKASASKFVRPSEGLFGLREWEDDVVLRHLIEPLERCDSKESENRRTAREARKRRRGSSLGESVAESRRWRREDESESSWVHLLLEAADKIQSAEEREGSLCPTSSRTQGVASCNGAGMEGGEGTTLTTMHAPDTVMIESSSPQAAASGGEVGEMSNQGPSQIGKEETDKATTVLDVSGEGDAQLGTSGGQVESVKQREGDEEMQDAGSDGRSSEPSREESGDERIGESVAETQYVALSTVSVKHLEAVFRGIAVLEQRLGHNNLQVGKSYLFLSRVLQVQGTLSALSMAQNALQRAFDILVHWKGKRADTGQLKCADSFKYLFDRIQKEIKTKQQEQHFEQHQAQVTTTGEAQTSQQEASAPPA